MFQKEDYPAKVGAQTCSKSKASKDLHHGTFYSTRPPNIPLITWKPPPKVLIFFPQSLTIPTNKRKCLINLLKLTFFLPNKTVYSQ